MSDLPPDSTVPPAPADPAAHPVHAELDNIEADLSSLSKMKSVPDEFVAWIKERFAKIRALL
jgi:hypothetical protein